MSKHTPGPWTLNTISAGKHEIWIDTGPDPRLGCESWQGMAIVHGCDDDPKIGKKVMKANARLIAAAPDLLEALRDLLAVMDSMAEAHHVTRSDRAAMSAARKVIAKATGGKE